jgi:hypothetical protein
MDMSRCRLPLAPQARVRKLPPPFGATLARLDIKLRKHCDPLSNGIEPRSHRHCLSRAQRLS